jgi:hypothetical protein
MSLNALVERLFRAMRFEHDVTPDSQLVAAINYLFTATASGQQQRPPYPWSGWQAGISTGTARLVLEELVVAGFEPGALLPIVAACKYAAKKERAILTDEDGTIRRLRGSAASARLFRKYRWNEFGSGFSSLGF